MLDVKKQIAKILDYLTVKTGTVSSGVTYVKRGSVVTVSANVKTVTPNTLTLLGTLPFEVAVQTYGSLSAVQSGTNYADVCYLRIDTDGKVYGFRRVGTLLTGSVTAIVGGVLHSSIFKAFSHFRKGGGVDEGQYKEAASKGAETHPAYRQYIYGFMDCNEFKCEQCESHQYADATSRDIFILLEGSCLQSVESVFSSLVGYSRQLYYSGERLWCWAKRFFVCSHIFTNNDCLCKNEFQCGNYIQLLGARLFKSGSHRITASERGWAVC